MEVYRMAWLQIVFGLVLIAAGVFLPTAAPHDARVEIRNIAITLVTVLLLCAPNLRACTVDMARKTALVLYLLAATSYILWEIYDISTLLTGFFISITLAVTVLFVDAFIRLRKIVSRKFRNRK